MVLHATTQTVARSQRDLRPTLNIAGHSLILPWMKQHGGWADAQSPRGEKANRASYGTKLVVTGVLPWPSEYA